MMPAIALVAFGSGMRWPIPLPLILLWPLVGLALALTAVARRACRRPGPTARNVALAHGALLAFCHLRGVEVDVHTSDGTRVYLRLI